MISYSIASYSIVSYRIVLCHNKYLDQYSPLAFAQLRAVYGHHPRSDNWIFIIFSVRC